MCDALPFTSRAKFIESEKTEATGGGCERGSKSIRISTLLKFGWFSRTVRVPTPIANANTRTFSKLNWSKSNFFFSMCVALVYSS